MARSRDETSCVHLVITRDVGVLSSHLPKKNEISTDIAGMMEYYQPQRGAQHIVDQLLMKRASRIHGTESQPNLRDSINHQHQNH